MTQISKQPLLSVIIPVHNAISYLQTCLDSICMQAISNIEIIVIDDARYLLINTKIRKGS